MMVMGQPPNQPRCGACKDGVQAPFDFSMAFQPIVDVASGTVYAYEALVRGTKGEGAHTILQQVTEENRYQFDQNCRVKAISLAAKLNLAATGALLSINFMPGAVYSPSSCIQLTLETSTRVGFPCNLLIFEITETEQVQDRAHLRGIVAEYRRLGFKVALDDFGAGHSGLNLLADFPTDIIKLDMELTRDLPNRPTALLILKTMVRLAEELGSELVAEGVETVEEFEALKACGVRLMQGYLFARPGFECLPDVLLPR
ncbi:EAL domain, c-di-GMP-specific phosphodiesterase class I (or its enzymatically inactive variant) [Granulicella pectinivorans]|uniref:EAL domain, c-di-GMP-specific phosphodiesterase class I (Or its enzymatically inactive variant) n=2 Tax=Granulicella pectinivorans TaxID=474950 RepID=A0A1I6M4F8_9BACT|nr:EAL domain, c-di-GMP-specific phosphodiesterase class I (or its enzymatically inactive variant) [Granulicella pectinivorans]